MTPDLDTRLNTVVTALQQVVIPALPATEVLALEQATLCIGQLNVLAEQYQHLGDYQALCLADISSLGAALADSAEGGPATTSAAGALRQTLREAGTRAARTSALSASADRERRTMIAHAVEALIKGSAEDGSEEFLGKSRQLIVEHGKRQSARDRSWFRGCGMDPDADLLPSIPEMIEVGRLGTDDDR